MEKEYPSDEVVVLRITTNQQLSVINDLRRNVEWYRRKQEEAEKSARFRESFWDALMCIAGLPLSIVRTIRDRSGRRKIRRLQAALEIKDATIRQMSERIRELKESTTPKEP